MSQKMCRIEIKKLKTRKKMFPLAGNYGIGSETDFYSSNRSGDTYPILFHIFLNVSRLHFSVCRSACINSFTVHCLHFASQKGGNLKLPRVRSTNMQSYLYSLIFITTAV